MQIKFLETKELYDGSQLISLRNYLHHKILGDSAVAWIGPCNVTFEHMVDGEDLLERAKIEGALMLHFIVEKFDISLFAAVGLQRLLAAIVESQVRALANNGQVAAAIRREGDDLYVNEKKLSISIATQSPVSSLIHFAVNVENQGTPVPTISLKELGVEPREFAQNVLERFQNEVLTIHQATQKVRWVR